MWSLGGTNKSYFGIFNFNFLADPGAASAQKRQKMPQISKISPNLKFGPPKNGEKSKLKKIQKYDLL